MALCVVSVSFHEGTIGVKELSMLVLPLFTTFLGATFAFRLNEKKEEDKLLISRKEAITRTLFILARQANAVHLMRREYDKRVDPIDRALNMPAINPPNYSDLTHNFSNLEFLLELEDPSLLLRLAVEQERFQQVIEAIKTRNEFYVNKYQPKLAEVGLNNKWSSKEELTKQLGEYIFDGINNGATEAYSHLQKSDTSIYEVSQELRQTALQLFPNAKFINFTRPT